MMELMAAIIAAGNADAPLMSLITGIRQGVARSVAFDYVTLSALPGGTTPTGDNHLLGDVTVTFSIWSEKGASAGKLIADALLTLFKDNLLTLSNGTVLNVVVSRPPTPMVQTSKNEQGKTVVMISLDIRYSLEFW